MLRIDPRAPASPIRVTLPVPNPDPNAGQQAEGVAVTKNGIWVTYGAPQRLARIDPLTNRVVFSRQLEGATRFQGSLLASDGETLWAVERDAHHIWRLDPRSGDTVTTGRIGDDAVEDAAVAGGYLCGSRCKQAVACGRWMTVGRPSRNIDTGSLPVGRRSRGRGDLGLERNDGTVTRIDQGTDRTATFEVGHRPLGLAVVDGRVLVSLGCPRRMRDLESLGRG